MESDFFQWVPSDRIRGEGQEHKSFPLDSNHSLLVADSDGALAQVTQDTCGVCILGEIEKSSEHGLGQTAHQSAQS